ncbi:MAG: DEAD/DEAH box helicase family protein, partial [Pirellulales bacterium]
MTRGTTPPGTMPPEQLARIRIDELLGLAGWVVQDAAAIDLSAGRGIAVREFPLATGFADYLLYADGKAIGVVEAKPEGFPLKGVETQSAKYTAGLPRGLPHHRLPLPFAYESTGSATQFTNTLEPDFRSREVFAFHRPEELIRLVGREKQLRSLLREMPALVTGQLWRVQVGSVTNLEKSLAENRPRALIQMATGSGKTFTAITAIYRLLKHARVKRVLFLVDTRNLGEQAEQEFLAYQPSDDNRKFTELYSVQRLNSSHV